MRLPFNRHSSPWGSTTWLQIIQVLVPKDELLFLSHIITIAFFNPNPAKVESITKIPLKKDSSEVFVFLDMISYVQKFIKGVEILSPRPRKLLIPSALLLEARERCNFSAH